MTHRTPVVSIVLLCLGAGSALAQSWVTFQSQTSQRLVVAPGLGASDPEEKDFAWGDVDKDGDDDVVIVRKQPFTTPGGRPNVLLMNEGIKEGHSMNGVLVDRTALLIPGFLDSTNDRDVILVDVTGDGWLDIVTATTYNTSLGKQISHPRVYVNRGLDQDGKWLGFVFDDINRMPTWTTGPDFCGVGAADIDLDGDTDLYFVDYGALEDRLLINLGNGYFKDETTLRMTSQMYTSGFGTSGHMWDFNGDRLPDVIKNQAGLTSITYNNPANPGFFNKYTTPYGGASYFVGIGDLNKDGRMDFVVADDGTDRYGINMGNNPDGTASFSMLSFSGDDGFGGTLHVADLNNDGFNDVFIADVDVDIPGCSRRAHLYRNLGNLPLPTLQEQGTAGIGSANLQGTFDAAILDIDGDGWLDIVLGRCVGTSVWINVPPAGLIFAYPQGLPAFVTPDQPHTFQVKVTGVGSASPVPGSGLLHIKVGQAFVSQPMTQVSQDTYQATLPAMACAGRTQFFVSAQLQGGGTFTDPAAAPADFYTAISAAGTSITIDDIEGDVSKWIIMSDATLTAGAWEQAIPNATIVAGLGLAAPDQDATAGDSVKCFVTLNGPVGGAASAWDVDGGRAILISPRIDLAGTDAEITYSRWFFCDDQGTSQADFLYVDVSNNDGATWTQVDKVAGTGSKWEVAKFLVSDYLTPSGLVRVRFWTEDTPNNSVTEAGIDAFQIKKIECATSECEWDLDGDGVVCQSDLGLLLAGFGVQYDQSDLGALLAQYNFCGGSCD